MKVFAKKNFGKFRNINLIFFWDTLCSFSINNLFIQNQIIKGYVYNKINVQ